MPLTTFPLGLTTRINDSEFLWGKNEINFYQTVKEGKCEDDVFVKTGSVNIKVTDEFKRGQKQTMRSILSTKSSLIAWQWSGRIFFFIIEKVHLKFILLQKSSFTSTF